MFRNESIYRIILHINPNRKNQIRKEELKKKWSIRKEVILISHCHHQFFIHKRLYITVCTRSMYVRLFLPIKRLDLDH
jgi:hypothetical protein